MQSAEQSGHIMRRHGNGCHQPSTIQTHSSLFEALNCSCCCSHIPRCFVLLFVVLVLYNWGRDDPEFSAQCPVFSSFSTSPVPGSVQQTSLERALFWSNYTRPIPHAVMGEMSKARDGRRSVDACCFRGSELRGFAMYGVYT